MAQPLDDAPTEDEHQRERDQHRGERAELHLLEDLDHRPQPVSSSQFCSDR
jgi:hypothetical protein